jgi:hypothetical protein
MDMTPLLMRTAIVLMAASFVFVGYTHALIALGRIGAAWLRITLSAISWLMISAVLLAGVLYLLPEYGGAMQSMRATDLAFRLACVMFAFAPGLFYMHKHRKALQKAGFFKPRLRSAD